MNDLEVIAEFINEQLREVEFLAHEEPTREHWNAVECLREAGARVNSAAIWLRRD